MAPAIIISTLHPYFKHKESEDAKRPKIQTSPYLASVTLDPETSLGKIFLEMILNFRTLHPRHSPANSVPCQSPRGLHSRCRGGDPGQPLRPWLVPAPILARRRALSHSAPVPLLLCPHQISCQRGPTAEGRCHRSGISGMAARLGGGTPPPPGSQAQAQRAGQTVSTHLVPTSAEPDGASFPAPWRLPPPRASSTGLPPPGQHPRLRRGKKIYF